MGAEKLSQEEFEWGGMLGSHGLPAYVNESHPSYTDWIHRKLVLKRSKQLRRELAAGHCVCIVQQAILVHAVWSTPRITRSPFEEHESLDTWGEAPHLRPRSSRKVLLSLVRVAADTHNKSRASPESARHGSSVL